jgi:group I intron endonuclease
LISNYTNEELSRSGVYLILNTANGHKYIGSAVNFNARYSRHIMDLNKNIHHCQHLQRSWNLYGSSVFTFNIVFYCNKENLLKYEQIMLDIYWDNHILCYNSQRKVGSNLGIIFSQETKDKVSKSLIGNSRSKGKKWSGGSKLKLVNRFSGDKCYAAKLTWEQVRQIRELYQNNRFLNQKELAKIYKISHSQINKIINNKKWKET